MLLRIVHYNDPILRKRGEKVTTFDAALIRYTEDLVQTMNEAGGIGLASQQVGRALQVAVIDLRETEADFDWILDGAHKPLELIMPLVLINPRLNVKRGEPETIVEEGCLSFPGIRGEVSRPDTLDVVFDDERGISHTLTCNGLFSRCVQHEADHLNGVLFIDRMPKKVRAALDEEIRALSKRTKGDRGGAGPEKGPPSPSEKSGASKAAAKGA